MFQAPDYTQTVSMKLSQVLADIGVHKRIVLKRRRTWLLIESMDKILRQTLDDNASIYYFGSQSEGTTTPGLHSDSDQLICHNKFNIIQDWSDWRPGVSNYLMIQDEAVSPGYCLLQRLRDDAPLPYNDVLNEYHVRDKTGRILLRNTVMSAAAAAVLVGEGVRHGPAYVQQAPPGVVESDIVPALPCKSWPLQARHWLDRQGAGHWPSDDLRIYCHNTGCFVVGVGSKCSENEEFEWRISTSLAERHLMFNLNITQIQCYILMKMILKTFIKPHSDESISSFMCKTVLLRLIAHTHSNFWKDRNLLVCLSLCLSVLYNSILNENCPHFTIPGNNLMRGHISRESRPYILAILQYIIHSKGRALLRIECDALGSRLGLKLNNLCSFNTDLVSGQLLQTTAESIVITTYGGLTLITHSGYEEVIQKLLTYVFKLVIMSRQSQGLDKRACNLLAPQFCSTLGSVVGSLNILQSNTLSASALSWISLGLNTDVASSKLKLASIFYCIGDTQSTEIVLRDIERSYEINNVEPICRCHNYIKQVNRRGFCELAANQNEEAIHRASAFCVKFLPCEMNCIPRELKYEIFRSTEEDFAYRGQYDKWMDCAVVDSLPYLYFLQYKTYSYLGKQDDKQRALSNLVMTTENEPNLGHRETALNLLGQCMEHENRGIDALNLYLSSLNLRRRNNVANFHICRLLSSVVNDQARNQSPE